MSGNRIFPARLRAVAVCLAAVLALTACGDDGRKTEVKALKEQVQRAFGAKKFTEQLQLSKKGLTLSREVLGDKAPDTLYFVQSVSEANLAMRNTRGAITALKNELAMRAAAGQPEARLQTRRALLIQIAEQAGDPMTAGDQAVAIAKGIQMGPGKDPQPVYQAPLTVPVTGEGDIEISYSLDSAGAVTTAQVVKSTPPQVFDQVALETFKKWRFTPMISSDGRAIPGSGYKFTMLIRQRR